VIVLDVGGMHKQSEQRTGRIGDDVALATVHSISWVKPAWAATFRRFRALAVDHAG
jgi:hypothetical protein